MNANVKLMHQMNRLIEAIRRVDENSTITIPSYANINRMNTETLVKCRNNLIRTLIRIAPSYPIKDLNLGNLQEIRSSSYVTDIQSIKIPTKEETEEEP